jgi:hypothetical protein
MILRTRLGLEQGRQPRVAVAGIVVDDGELARALRDQRVDQRGRHAGVAEAADHDGRAVVHVGDGVLQRFQCFVDHIPAFFGSLCDNRTNDRLPHTQCSGVS